MATANPATNGPSVLDLPDEELAKYASPEALFAAHPELALASVDAAGNTQSDPDADDARAQENQDQGEEQGDQTRQPDAAGEAGRESQDLNPSEDEGDAEGANQESNPHADGKPAPEKKPEGDTQPGDKSQAPGSKKEGEAEAKPDTPAGDDAQYAAEYKKLLAPFKAAGKEMQVQSPEEMIQLMQMGAGYVRKMQQLKPNLAKMKLLEQHGLLDETKLGFVIDLVVNKNPDAINKLLKDNGLDPMNLDPDKAGNYQPTKQTGDVRTVELDEVLDQLESEPHYQKLITTVSKQWDQASKNIIGEDPNWLLSLNAHMNAGIFDLVSNEVNRLRSLGQLPASVSDLAAYKQIGDSMAAAGKFAHLGNAQPQGQQTPPERRIVTPTNSSQGAEDKRNEKRRAASTSKPAPNPVKPKPDFNPLALSDEEFAKLDLSKFQR